MSFDVRVIPENATSGKIRYTTSDQSVAAVSEDGTIMGGQPGQTTVSAISADNTEIKRTVTVNVEGEALVAEFEDMNFKQAVIDAIKKEQRAVKLYDYSNYTTKSILYPEDMRFVKTLDVANMDIFSLKGIEYCQDLLSLDCEANNISYLDVSMLQNLNTLNCRGNNLNELKFDAKTRWVSIDMEHNSLDVSDGSRLKNDIDSLNSTAVIKHGYQKAFVPISSFTMQEELTGERLSRHDLIFAVEPANATNKKLLWTSSDPSVAEVDENGMVTINSVGTAIIKAHLIGQPDISASCLVNGTELTDAPINFRDKNLKWFVLSMLRGRLEYNGYNLDSDIRPSDVNRIKDTSLSLDLIVSSHDIKDYYELCYFKQASSLTFSNLYMDELNIRMPNITSISISNSYVKKLKISNVNNLTGITVTNSIVPGVELVRSGLYTLNAVGCKLTNLDIEDCNITNVLVSNNNLRHLDFSGTYGVVNLRCDNNRIESLNLGNSDNVRVLVCNNNRIESINITSQKIDYLNCPENRIVNLVVPVNATWSTGLVCRDNYLDVSAKSSFYKQVIAGFLVTQRTIIYNPQNEGTGYSPIGFYRDLYSINADAPKKLYPMVNYDYVVDDSLVWESLDPNLLSVEQDGMIQGHGFGVGRVKVSLIADPTVYAITRVFIASGQGTEDSPFIIKNAADLFTLSELSCTDDYDLHAIIDKAHYMLEPKNGEYIDLGNKPFKPMFFGLGAGVKFSGVFNGNNKEIRGLNIVQSIDGSKKCENVGLFANINEATIKNLTLSGEVYASTSTQSNGNSAGMLVGNADMRCIIDNVHVSGYVTGKNVASVGGLVGRFEQLAYISDCGSSSEVFAEQGIAGGMLGSAYNAAVSNSFATGKVTGDIKAGGFLGFGMLNVRDCYATGDVFSAQGTAGGFIGEATNLIGTNSYAAGKVSGFTNAGGYCGYIKYISDSKIIVFGDVKCDGIAGGFIGVEGEGTYASVYKYLGQQVIGASTNTPAITPITLADIKNDEFMQPILGDEYKYSDKYLPKLYYRGTNILLPNQPDCEIKEPSISGVKVQDNSTFTERMYNIDISIQADTAVEGYVVVALYRGNKLLHTDVEPISKEARVNKSVDLNLKSGVYTQKIILLKDLTDYEPLGDYFESGYWIN